MWHLPMRNMILWQEFAMKSLFILEMVLKQQVFLFFSTTSDLVANEGTTFEVEGVVGNNPHFA